VRRCCRRLSPRRLASAEWNGNCSYAACAPEAHASLLASCKPLMLFTTPRRRNLSSRLCRLLWLYSALLLTQMAHATCEKLPFSDTGNEAAAPIPFGRINLTHPADPALNPRGTLIASIVVPPTNYTAKGATADSVMWRCDKTDLDSGEVYFLVSTNGDSRLGGHNDIGRADGLVDVYATWFKHVGLRLSMEGVLFSRYWRKVPLKNYALVNQNGKEKVEIRLGDIPPLQAELYRVSQPTPRKGRSKNCAGYLDLHGASEPSAAGTMYDCPLPNAYIHLHGPGLEGKQDEIGDDHNTRYKSWSGNNGFAYRLYRAASLSALPSCVVRSATPHVSLGTLSVQQLEAGAEASSTFRVEVDCNQNALSGTLDGQTAIGLQVSTGAFAAARKLGLVHDEGVEYLLSDQYGSERIAKGVGIALYDAGGHQRRFVGQPGSVGKGYPRGPSAGWYPVKHYAHSKGEEAPGGDSRQQLDFTARLVKLQAQQLTPGKVRATAHVLVRVQ